MSTVATQQASDLEKKNDLLSLFKECAESLYPVARFYAKDATLFEHQCLIISHNSLLHEGDRWGLCSSVNLEILDQYRKHEHPPGSSEDLAKVLNHKDIMTLLTTNLRYLIGLITRLQPATDASWELIPTPREKYISKEQVEEIRDGVGYIREALQGLKGEIGNQKVIFLANGYCELCSHGRNNLT